MEILLLINYDMYVKLLKEALRDLCKCLMFFGAAECVAIKAFY